MNRGTDFTALDLYQPERFGEPVKVSPPPSSTALLPEEDDEDLEPVGVTSTRTVARTLAPTEEPIPIEQRPRGSIRRSSMKVAAAVIVVQVGIILLTIAARQSRSNPSARLIEPLTHAGDFLDTTRQSLTARADDTAPTVEHRDLRPDAVSTTGGGNVNAASAPRAPKAARAVASAPAESSSSRAASRVVSPTAPAVALIDAPAAAKEITPVSTTGDAAPTTSTEATPSPSIPVETTVPQTPVVRDAELLSYVRPTYPSVAKQTGITGGVEVDMTIDASGRVIRSFAVSGPKLLRGATESALRQWRFRPASVDGTPVTSRRRYLVSFSAPSTDNPDGIVNASEPGNP